MIGWTGGTSLEAWKSPEVQPSHWRTNGKGSTAAMMLDLQKKVIGQAVYLPPSHSIHDGSRSTERDEQKSGALVG